MYDACHNVMICTVAQKDNAAFSTLFSASRGESVVIDRGDARKSLSFLATVSGLLFLV